MTARADLASLRPVFRPASVAVVGASRRTGRVGRALLHNVVASGYQGQVYCVNPRALHMEGVPCLPSVASLPEPADLAVIAVPPPAVAAVSDKCGRRGIRALAVITTGLDPLQGADLLAACRRYGMRLVGPGSFGIAVPALRLDATLAARHPSAGTVGLMTQSNGTACALVDHLSRLGLGISSFAAVGEGYDVAAPDVLGWWQQDGTTRLGVLGLDPATSPLETLRAAWRAARGMPVLAWPGTPESRDDDDAAAGPGPGAPGLISQAGLIPCADAGEVADLAALLGSQPLPEGRHVAVVSNTAGTAALAAGACTGYGLDVPALSTATRRRLRSLVSTGGSAAAPVSTGLGIGETAFRRCLELAADDEGTDAVVALVLPTAAGGDLVAAICSATTSVPLAAVVLGQAEPVRLLTAAGSGHVSVPRPGSVPAFASPGAAALALARAAAYGAWRSRPTACPGGGPGGEPSDTAQGLKRAFLQ